MDKPQSEAKKETAESQKPSESKRGEVTPMAESVVIQTGTIQYCQKHWSKLMFGLIDRNLQPYMAEDNEQLTEKLANGMGDACFETHTFITSQAIGLFGPAALINMHGGCPACAFENIIDHVSDVMAIKFRGKQ